MVEFFMSPLKGKKGSFFFLWAVLIIPTIIYCMMQSTIADAIHMFFRISYYWLFLPEFLLAYFLSLIIVCFDKISGNLYRVVNISVYSFVCVFAFVDSVLALNFGTHINSFMFQLLKQSNVNESVEFLSTYVFSAKTCLIFILFTLLECVLYGVSKLSSGLSLKIKNKYDFGCLLSMLFFVASASIWISCNSERTSPEENLVASWLYSFRQYESNSIIIDHCIKTHDVTSVDSCDYVSNNIVVVIGESYNKYHSGLYGYRLQTNPLLSSVANLYHFDNVISSVNGTTASFQNFMSMHSVESNGMWYDTPLFPDLFKKSGYNVVFWSNQFAENSEMSFFDAACSFLFHPNIKSALFTHKNLVKFKYDEQLIDNYKINRDSVEKNDLNLIIFHLSGQHVDPSTKFPPQKAFFKLGDYDCRSELSLKEKQQVADYDNATLYNDSIVFEIISMYKDKDAIVLYFSDHGDEVHDYRSHVGRSTFSLNNALGLHCQLDIPFVIYISDLYKERHPEVVRRIENNVHLPFMTDDLPHLLLDLAGIHSSWYDPKRSLINEAFDFRRKRNVNDFSFSMSFDYDSICSAYGPWKIGWRK